LIIWSAVDIGNNTLSVANTLFIITFTNFAFGIFIGTILDRKNPNFILFISNALFFLSIIALLFFYNKTKLKLDLLYIFVFISSLTSLFSKGALDKIFQNITHIKKRRQIIAISSIFQQIALILGTTTAGIIINKYGI
jgi:MFS family permease